MALPTRSDMDGVKVLKDLFEVGGAVHIAGRPSGVAQLHLAGLVNLEATTLATPRALACRAGRPGIGQPAY
jgi:hypothetical protein